MAIIPPRPGCYRDNGKHGELLHKMGLLPHRVWTWGADCWGYRLQFFLCESGSQVKIWSFHPKGKVPAGHAAVLDQLDQLGTIFHVRWPWKVRKTLWGIFRYSPLVKPIRSNNAMEDRVIKGTKRILWMSFHYSFFRMGKNKVNVDVLWRGYNFRNVGTRPQILSKTLGFSCGTPLPYHFYTIK